MRNVATGRTPSLVAVGVVVALLGLGASVPSAATPAPAPIRHAAATTLDTAAPAGGGRGAPVSPQPVTLVQPDGTTFAARAWGDGAAHGYEDLHGYTVSRRADGAWVYLQAVGADGTGAPGPKRAGSTPPAATEPHLRPDAGTGPTSPARARTLHGKVSGTAPTLVLLTQFANQASVGTTPASWAAKYFGATSSVADYYAAASYGKLALAPAKETSGTANDGVVGWLTIARNHPNAYNLDDTNAQSRNATVHDAIVAANPYVNFGQYDTNHDGLIETRELHVVVIAAGFEAAYAPDARCGNSMWGHQWSIYYVTPPTVDGVEVAGPDGGYTMFGEQHCDSSAPPGHQATIGIMVHELGHDMGLPDMYAYSADAGGGGVGAWSIMSQGVWLGLSGQLLGSSPALPDPFSRSYQGWTVPTQVRGSNRTITLPASETSSTVYRVLNNPDGVDWAFSSGGDQVGTGEYFLIENRQKIGYDAALPGCGILIWHIDETRDTDAPNDSLTRRLVTVEQADGLGDLESGGDPGDGGDPYPGTSGNTQFSGSSTPNSHLYSGASTGVTVKVPAGACAASKTITVSSPDVATPAPFATWEALVDRQFLDISGQTITASRRGAWVNRIKANFGGQYDLVSELRAGADGSGNVDPVIRLYRAYFLRNPDRSGFAYWVGKKRKGTTLTSISSSFAASGEFVTRYGALSNQAFVEQVYENVLGRAGDPGGVAYWTGQLDGATRTRGQVMVGFSESSEYKRVTKVVVKVSAITLLMLGRPPTDAEVDAWTTLDGAGQLTDRALAQWVFLMPEYSAHIA